jgi:hypothetical protein
LEVAEKLAKSGICPDPDAHFDPNVTADEVKVIVTAKTNVVAVLGLVFPDELTASATFRREY